MNPKISTSERCSCSAAKRVLEPGRIEDGTDGLRVQRSIRGVEATDSRSIRDRGNLVVGDTDIAHRPAVSAEIKLTSHDVVSVGLAKLTMSGVESSVGGAAELEAGGRVAEFVRHRVGVLRPAIRLTPSPLKRLSSLSLLT